MNKISFLITIKISILLIACSNSNQVNDNNSLHFYKLNGKVASIRDISYHPLKKSGKWEAGEQMDGSNDSMTFNEIGFFEVWINYDKNNQILARKKYEFDTSNGFVETVYDNSGKLISRTKGTTNDKNRIIKAEEYDADSMLISISMIEYSADDNPVRGKVINNDNVTLESWESEFEGKLLMHQVNYDELGRLFSDGYYRYNKHNDVVYEKVSYPGMLEEELKYEYEYDEHGNWVQKIIMDDKGNGLQMIKRRIVYFK